MSDDPKQRLLKVVVSFPPEVVDEMERRVDER